MALNRRCLPAVFSPPPALGMFASACADGRQVEAAQEAGYLLGPSSPRCLGSQQQPDHRWVWHWNPRVRLEWGWRDAVPRDCGYCWGGARLSCASGSWVAMPAPPRGRAASSFQWREVLGVAAVAMPPACSTATREVPGLPGEHEAGNLRRYNVFGLGFFFFSLSALSREASHLEAVFQVSSIFSQCQRYPVVSYNLSRVFSFYFYSLENLSMNFKKKNCFWQYY